MRSESADTGGAVPGCGTPSTMIFGGGVFVIAGKIGTDGNYATYCRRTPAFFVVRPLRFWRF